MDYTDRWDILYQEHPLQNETERFGIRKNTRSIEILILNRHVLAETNELWTINNRKINSKHHTGIQCAKTVQTKANPHIDTADEKRNVDFVFTSWRTDAPYTIKHFINSWGTERAV